jgi:large subunit ribosomal protein L15
MKLHELKPAENATQLSKRIGRGQGSGKGGTSTKGHKGAQSRSGYSRKIGFEGGQMPIYRLLPKRGFKNINRVEYSPINLSTLQMLADKTQQKEITLELMKANGLISLKDKIKILGNGEITSKLTVTAHAFSASAKEAIENAGGKCVVLMVVEEGEGTKGRKEEGTKGRKDEGTKELPSVLTDGQEKGEKEQVAEAKVEEPPVVEAPVAEPLVVEEAPVAEAPVAETSEIETPAIENPVAETLVAENIEQ